MERARWLERIGPPSVFMSTALLIAAAFPAGATIGTPTRAAGMPAAACRMFDGPAAVARAATTARAAGASARDQVQLGARGELTGRRLQVQAAAGGPLAVTLPPESFVAPATGNIVVYGTNTEAGAEVHAIDLVSGCDLVLVRPAEIVRSALLDGAGTSLFVHSVTAAGRNDAGVARHDLATGAATAAVPPLAPSEHFGPTFGTQLALSLDGSALAVQSCGIGQCRTRILDTATGRLEQWDAPPGHGPLVGVTARTLFVLDDLHGLPGALLAIDRQSGVLTRLHEEVFDASLEQSGATAVLRMETAAGVQEVTE